jgi:hypothetical protein
METTNYKKQTYWKARLDEWKDRAIEQQHFHESVSSYLKTVYGKSHARPKACNVWKD